MPVFTTSIAVGTALGIGGAGLAAGLGGAAVLGAGAFGATQLLGKATKSKGGDTPSLTALPAPPSIDTAALEAKASIDKKRKAISRNKTVYTSPLGLSDSYKSDASLKTLTGQ